MLLQRILTALIAAPLVALLILWPSTTLFAVLIAIVFLVALWEWARLSGLTHWASQAVLLILAIFLFALLWLGRHSAVLWPMLIGVGICWWLFACLWLRHFSFGASPTKENCALKLIAGILIIFPAWIAALSIHRSEPHGHIWVFLTLLIVWAADSGAYFSGRSLGRRKLAPQISPNKTWAGIWGALAAGILIVAISGKFMGLHGIKLFELIALAIFTIAASTIGDLLESLMKRHAEVKDSGHLFPGHGGLLDRLDSVLAALPIFAAGKLLLGL